jgi:hypothetical protein
MCHKSALLSETRLPPPLALEFLPLSILGPVLGCICLQSTFYIVKVLNNFLGSCSFEGLSFCTRKRGLDQNGGSQTKVPCHQTEAKLFISLFEPSRESHIVAASLNKPLEVAVMRKSPLLSLHKDRNFQMTSVLFVLCSWFPLPSLSINPTSSAQQNTHPILQN